MRIDRLLVLAGWALCIVAAAVLVEQRPGIITEVDKIAWIEGWIVLAAGVGMLVVCRLTTALPANGGKALAIGALTWGAVWGCLGLVYYWSDYADSHGVGSPVFLLLIGLPGGVIFGDALRRWRTRHSAAASSPEASRRRLLDWILLGVLLLFLSRIGYGVLVLSGWPGIGRYAMVLAAAFAVPAVLVIGLVQEPSSGG